MAAAAAVAPAAVLALLGMMKASATASFPTASTTMATNACAVLPLESVTW